MGHYEFVVMPFGSQMHLPHSKPLWTSYWLITWEKYVLVFFDDILIFSKFIEDHKVHLAQVFEILRNNQLFAELSKCEFAQENIEYLRHIISTDGVDPMKIRAMCNWPGDFLVW
jgi:hypothetical protein